MTKTLMVFGGLGLAGATYLYIKKQLDLALSYEYDIKNIRILSLNDKVAEIEADIKLYNKSAFSVLVESYDLEVFYKNVPVARTFSTTSFQILPDSFSIAKATGSVEFDIAKSAILPFVTDVLKQRPITIVISGFVKVRFMGMSHTVRFDKQNYQYSSNLLQDLGWDDNWQNLKDKYSFLNKL